MASKNPVQPIAKHNTLPSAHDGAGAFNQARPTWPGATSGGLYGGQPAILLLSCYELGHQPFNLASPLAALADGGFTARGIDLAVEALSPELARGARLVGISAPMHTALRVGEQAARDVRRANPTAHICFYGHYAELNADYLLDGVADSVVAGEYEPALVGLAESLTTGAFTPANPPDGVRTSEAAAAPTIRRIPFAIPDRTNLPGLDQYAYFVHRGACSLAGYVEASRGCKHVCAHCPITPVYNGRFFVAPVETVLADIRTQVRMGACHITFGDPDFLNGPGHALRIVRAMHAEFPQLTFDFTAKIEHLQTHALLLPELAALGCRFVVSAVESLSDVVLAELAKGHSRADVEAVLHSMDAVGIALRPSLVAFTPWTTLEDYIEVLAFVRAHDLVEHIDPVQFAIRLLIPPGSALLQTHAGAPWLGALEPENYGYTWTHPDARMDRLYADVAALVADAARRDADVRRTFAAIEELAYGCANAPLPTPRVPRRRRASAPRLTESWFC